MIYYLFRRGADAEDGDDKTLDIYSRCESEGSECCSSLTYPNTLLAGTSLYFLAQLMTAMNAMRVFT